ncbi:hypothetical protein DPMN_064339 [Dreissena polymorpha]|uniref:Uncharacterized protein n=1 Tax=Dreissena polymorpha TaxID=45954 RepID=A0A9D4HM19_DREPO|nr:hypothetical protein DPMN_064339 [Dreissena polymorpha]
MATAATTRLRLLTGSSISFATKYRLFKSLEVSILLYGCEAWTLYADTERRTHLNIKVSEDCSASATRSTRPTSTSGNDRQTTKAGLVWTRH